jgi:hypothetical protein
VGGVAAHFPPFSVYRHLGGTTLGEIYPPRLRSTPSFYESCPASRKTNLNLRSKTPYPSLKQAHLYVRDLSNSAADPDKPKNLLKIQELILSEPKTKRTSATKNVIQVKKHRQKSAIGGGLSETGEFRLENRNSKFKNRNLKIENRNFRKLKLETRKQKLKTRNSKTETQDFGVPPPASIFQFQVSNFEFRFSIF